jgi:hypothetical protein
MALLQGRSATLHMNDRNRLADGEIKTKVSLRETADTKRRVSAPPAKNNNRSDDRQHHRVGCSSFPLRIAYPAFALTCPSVGLILAFELPHTL